jgi:site-specific recombinase XerD
MLERANTHRPINRTLAVIDGGLNFKAGVQTLPTIPKPKLLDQVRQAIRTRHYSPKTEESYVHWIKRFIFFHNKRHPAEMSEKEIAQFLSSLASELHVSASTQNQALNAILFLYRDVLRKEIGYIDGVIRAKRPHRLPVVLTRQEVKSILAVLDHSDWLMVMLLTEPASA